jgi:hypothetical protein
MLALTGLLAAYYANKKINVSPRTTTQLDTAVDTRGDTRKWLNAEVRPGEVPEQWLLAEVAHLRQQQTPATQRALPMASRPGHVASPYA